MKDVQSLEQTTLSIYARTYAYPSIPESIALTLKLKLSGSGLPVPAPEWGFIVPKDDPRIILEIEALAKFVRDRYDEFVSVAE